MSTVTKKQIIEMVAESTGLPETKVKNVVEGFFESVESVITAGDKVQLQGIGSFEVRNSKERIARNPRNPSEEILVPACKKPVFKFSDKVKERINENC